VDKIEAVFSISLFQVLFVLYFCAVKIKQTQALLESNGSTRLTNRLPGISLTYTKCSVRIAQPAILFSIFW
jgi:hypothetical protein